MRINWFKTIYCNFKLLPYRQAIKMPIFCGKNTFINNYKRGGVKIASCNITPGMIKIGVNYEKCISSKDEQTVIDVAGYLEFGGRADIGKGTKIVVLPKGELYIGSSFAITGHSSFRVYRYAKIGDNCLFSWDILLMDYDGHQIFDSNGNRINDHRPLIIGDNVWIGCRTSIWDGADIPNGAVIGNNACIKKKILPSSSVFVSNGVLVRSNVTWNR